MCILERVDTEVAYKEAFEQGWLMDKKNLYTGLGYRGWGSLQASAGQCEFLWVLNDDWIRQFWGIFDQW